MFKMYFYFQKPDPGAYFFIYKSTLVLTLQMYFFQVVFKINAYAELLGLGAEINIDISDKGMFFNIFGSIFNTFEANVSVSAPAPGPEGAKDAKFAVSSI